MFMLVTRSDREIVRMRDGKPFTYSSRVLADLGRKALETHNKTKLAVMSFS